MSTDERIPAVTVPPGERGGYRVERFEITEAEPAIKGDTVSNVMKGATVETGLTVKVPMFVKVGDRIKIDTREGKYIERA